MLFHCHLRKQATYLTHKQVYFYSFYQRSCKRNGILIIYYKDLSIQNSYIYLDSNICLKIDTSFLQKRNRYIYVLFSFFWNKILVNIISSFKEKSDGVTKKKKEKSDDKKKIKFKLLIEMMKVTKIHIISAYGHMHSRSYFRWQHYNI